MADMGDRRILKMALACFALVGLVVPLATTVTFSADVASDRLDIAKATPIELGTRYGQAAGVAVLCYGLKVMPKAEQLKNRFSGADREAFDKQAAKILAAWQKTLRCENSGGPNECKLSHTWSCQLGLKELGPNGTVLPGLVEQRVK